MGTKRKNKSSKRSSKRQSKAQLKYDLTDKEKKSMSIEEKELYLRSRRKPDGGATGWNPLEAACFHLALRKYGCGHWDTINYFLPHQNTAQFNCFGQKLFGQQSLYAFSNIVLEPYESWKEVCTQPGLRKNGVKTHEGPPLTSAKKREVKDSWRKRETRVDYEIPVVENRGRNYTKLYQQVCVTEQKVLEECQKRGIKDWQDTSPITPEDAKMWLDQPEKWPTPVVWDVDKELECLAGQDNVYPLIRLVEDEDWYRSDQMLHWAFLDGSCFLDEEIYPKPKKNVDISIAGLNPKNFIKPEEAMKGLVKKIPAPKKPVIDEEEVEDNEDTDEEEEEEVEEKEETVAEEEDSDDDVAMEEPTSARPAANDATPVKDWTKKDFLKFLEEHGFSQGVISRAKERKLDGENCLNLTIEQSEYIFGDAQTKYDISIMSTLRKFGYCD